MAQQWWSEDVTIESRIVGRYVTINSTERAAEYMLDEWPAEQRGEAFDAAKQALIDAHEGTVSVDYALRAFVAAAEGAEIFFYKSPR
ncbi:DUF982 domain-containing protein [Rhizobium jaguaris]|nr:DUF982 domain-containing protein [Rhizobium jaguaris]